MLLLVTFDIGGNYERDTMEGFVKVVPERIDQLNLLDYAGVTASVRSNKLLHPGFSTMIHKKTSTQRFRDLGLAVLLLALALTATVSAQIRESSPTTIKNFGKLNEHYYRGSQPGENEIEQLKRLGIKTVIDLRKDKETGAGEWVTRAGLQYFNIPLKASRAATEEQTSYFMSLVNDPANWPVYVHCKGGRHRTGALSAIYRITQDGWTAEQAFSEMKRYDFDHGWFGGPSAQKKFVFSFYERYTAHHLK